MNASSPLRIQVLCSSSGPHPPDQTIGPVADPVNSLFCQFVSPSSSSSSSVAGVEVLVEGPLKTVYISHLLHFVAAESVYKV